MTDDPEGASTAGAADADDGTDWRALRALGWDDPPDVPPVPGDGLAWDAVEVDGGVVLVARDPDEGAAWLSARVARSRR